MIKKQYVWSLVNWLSTNIVPVIFMKANYKYCGFEWKMYGSDL